jgi:hypothetical protein
MAVLHLRSAIRFCGYLLTGRVHFPREPLGARMVNKDERECVVVKYGYVDPLASQPPEPGVTFMVRFHLAHMSKAANDRFLNLPIPLFMGLPGFRSKYWLYDEETGDYQGRYQWDTVALAERYADSFAMKFMTWRSLPGSVSFEIQEGAAER